VSATVRGPQHLLPPSQVSVDFYNQLGAGSFGKVCKGKYQGKECAVKIFNTGVLKKDIKKEAEVSFMIQHHHNIVQVYGLWYNTGEKEDGASSGRQPAIVMELCSNNLKAYLDDKRKCNDSVTLKNKLTILHQITSAMIYLHSQNVVHGDLSAANVLLQTDGPESSQALTVKVADFGKARVLNAETLKYLTKTHGNADIMPPEIFQKKGANLELTIQVDVFSFGCLVPYVATYVYPTPAQTGSEFARREKLLDGLKETQKRIFTPLMKKCLENDRHCRGTFENVLSMLVPHVKSYVNKGYSESEDEMKREIENLKSKIVKQEREYKELQDKKEYYKSSNVQLEDKLSSQEEKVDSLQGELTDCKSRISQLEQENAGMETDVKGLQALQKIDLKGVLQDSIKLTKENEDATKEVKILQAMNLQLRTECDELKEKVKNLKEQQDVHERQINVMKREAEEAAQDRSGLTNILQTTTSSLATTREECRKLQAKVDSLKGDLKRAESEKSTLSGELTAVNEKKSSLQKKLDASNVTSSNAQSKITQLDDQVKSLQGTLSIKTSSYILLDKDRDKFKKQYDQESKKSADLEVRSITVYSGKFSWIKTFASRQKGP
jgi:serine/threonine protein kinase